MAAVSRLECCEGHPSTERSGRGNGKHKCPQMGAYLLLQMEAKRPLWPEVGEGVRVTQGGAVQVQEELEREHITTTSWAFMMGRPEGLGGKEPQF